MEVEINYFLKKPSFLWGFREIDEEVFLFSFKNEDIMVSLSKMGEAYETIHTTESLFLLGEQMHNLFLLMDLENIKLKRLVKAFKTIQLPFMLIT